MDDLATSQPLVGETTPGLLPSVYYENMAANAAIQLSPPTSRKRLAVGVRISRKAPSASPAKSPVAPPPPPPPTRPARRSVYEIPLSDDEDEGRGATSGWPTSPAAPRARQRTERSNQVEVPDSQPTSTTVHAPANPAEPAPTIEVEQSGAQNIKRRSTWAKHSRSNLRKVEKKGGGRDTTRVATEAVVASSSQIQPKPRKSVVSRPAFVSGESDTIVVTPSPAEALVMTGLQTLTLPKRVRAKPKNGRQSTSKPVEKYHTKLVDEAVPEESPGLERSLWTFRKTKPAAKKSEPEHKVSDIQDDTRNDSADGDLSHFDVEPASDATPDVDIVNSTLTQDGSSVEDETMDIEPHDDDTQDELKTPMHGHYNGDEESRNDVPDDGEEESPDDESGTNDEEHQNDEPYESNEESQIHGSDDDDVLANLRPSTRESRASASKKNKDETYSAPASDTDASELSESSSGEDEIPPSAPPNYKGPTRKRRSNISRKKPRSSEHIRTEHQIPVDLTNSTTTANRTTAVERALDNVRELRDPPDVRSTGPFTWDEQEIIRRAVRAYQVRKGLEPAALVEIIQSTSNEHLRDRRELWGELKIHTSFRDKASVRNHVRAHYHMFKAGGWTEEEDEQLKNLGRRYPSQWKVIAQRLNRTRFEINSRWREIQQRGLDRRQEKPKRWSKWEECLLLDAVTTVTQRDEDARAKAGRPPCSEYNRNEFDWPQVALEMGNTRSAVQCFEKWAHLRRRVDPPKITINIKPRKTIKSGIQPHDAETEEEPVQAQDDGPTQDEPVQPRMSEEPFQFPMSEEQPLTEPHQSWIKYGGTQKGSVRAQMSDAQTQAEPIRPQMSDAQTQANSVVPQMQDAETQAESIRPKMKDAQTQTEPVLHKVQDAQTLTEPVRPWMSENRGTLTKCQCQCQCQSQPSASQASISLDEGETVEQQQSRSKARELDDTQLESPQVEEEELAWMPQAEEEPISIPQVEVEPVAPAKVSSYSPQNRRRRRTPDVTRSKSPQQEDDEEPAMVVEAILSSREERRAVNKTIITPPQSRREEVEEEEEAATAMEDTLENLPRSHKARESEATSAGPQEGKENVEATTAPEASRDKRKRHRKSRKSIVTPEQPPQAEEASVARRIVNSRPVMLWGDKFDLVETIFLNEQENKDSINWEDVATGLKRSWPVATLQAGLKELFGLVEARQLVGEAASYEDYMFAVMDFLSREHGSELDEYYQSDAQEEAHRREKVGSANLPNGKSKSKEKRKRKRAESRLSSVQHGQASVGKKQKRSLSRPSTGKGFRSVEAIMEGEDAGSVSEW